MAFMDLGQYQPKNTLDPSVDISLAQFQHEQLVDRLRAMAWENYERRLNRLSMLCWILAIALTLAIIIGICRERLSAPAASGAPSGRATQLQRQTVPATMTGIASMGGARVSSAGPK